MTACDVCGADIFPRASTRELGARCLVHAVGPVMRPAAGARIQNTIGHWYDVIAGGPGLLRVQPLTWRGAELVPIGGPCWAPRSDFKREHLQ